MGAGGQADAEGRRLDARSGEIVIVIDIVITAMQRFAKNVRRRRSRVTIAA
jgi:hypothetical protein